MFTVLVNFAYVLMLCAFLARDILWLRSLMVTAQILVVVYTWHAGVPVVSLWNAVFVSINIYMVVQILRERRAVVLPPELAALHARHFAAMTPPEFLRFWRMGSRDVVRDAALTRRGERPAALAFVLNGVVRVTRDGVPLASLGAGYFVAEMSLITGEAANADADVAGTAELMRWPTAALREFGAAHPAMWTKIQSVIGHDLVEKIHRVEHAPGAAAAAVAART
jgi:CRP-like cAMP-binding protein